MQGVTSWRRLLSVVAAACLLAGSGVIAAAAAAQTSAGAAGVAAVGRFTPPRTPWGDPDLQGVYTNKDESGIPMEKPDEIGASAPDELDDSEFAEIIRERNARTRERAPRAGGITGAGPVHWYENYDAHNSRLWLVVDPPSGHIPPLTAAAEQRTARRSAERALRAEADSWEDRSLYDRCISLSVPGSMTPKIYGNSYEIYQAPGYVAIRYEMVHETRIVPLDSRPRLGGDIRQYMGDARGHFEGDTLVVETTNFHPNVNNRGATENLRLVERFTPVAPDKLEWSVTYDDPETWTAPWTFAMRLTKDATQAIFEYACHEGNYGLRNILSAARSAEAGREP